MHLIKSCTHDVGMQFSFSGFSIPQDSRKIFNGIKFIVTVIGKCAKTSVQQGAHFHHITVVVETTLPEIFPAEGLYQLQGPEVTMIAFKYIARNLRCFFCFSYRHLPTQCNSPRPAFFKASDLDKGTPPPAPQVATVAVGALWGGINRGNTPHKAPCTAQASSGKSAQQPSTLLAFTSMPIISAPRTSHHGRYRSLPREGPRSVSQVSTDHLGGIATDTTAHGMRTASGSSRPGV